MRRRVKEHCCCWQDKLTRFPFHPLCTFLSTSPALPSPKNNTWKSSVQSSYKVLKCIRDFLRCLHCTAPWMRLSWHWSCSLDFEQGNDGYRLYDILIFLNKQQQRQCWLACCIACWKKAQRTTTKSSFQSHHRQGKRSLQVKYRGIV